MEGSSSSNNPGRFGRISSLVDVDTLRRRRVLVIGLGSMGQPVVNQLVRHGVGTLHPGRLHVVDGDVVTDSNLIGTQYRSEHVGQPKALAAGSIIGEINSEANVSHWNRNVAESDIPQIAEEAHGSHLIGLFADTFDVMLGVADHCADMCPVVMAVFGPNADYAEVALSVPGVTPTLRRTMGSRPRQRISTPRAFGCDTAFVANFVAAVCLELLLAPADRGKIVQCYANAPLFVVGLRRSWIFERQPEDIPRTVVCVHVPF